MTLSPLRTLHLSLSLTTELAVCQVREQLLHIGKVRWAGFMKKHGLLSKNRQFNKKKFPLPQDLDYSGQTLYLVGWWVDIPTQFAIHIYLRGRRLPPTATTFLSTPVTNPTQSRKSGRPNTRSIPLFRLNPRLRSMSACMARPPSRSE